MQFSVKRKLLVRKSVVVFLLIMIVLVGCGEDELEQVTTTEVISGEVLTEIIWGKDSAKMVLIPAGSFEMGDTMNDDLFMDGTRPIHTVELDAFYMDINEVTVGQFKHFVEESGYDYGDNWPTWNDVAKYSPTDDYPMIYISWDDATAYATWARKRLPTEAEWEYAARGGLTGKRYPWGDDIIHDNANYLGIAGKDRWDSISPVGSFEFNGYGLYDVAGNVFEWCNDWYDENYYSNSPERNPRGPSLGVTRVLRGGSWHFGPLYQRVAFRLTCEPVHIHNYLGFRCVSGFPGTQQ